MCSAPQLINILWSSKIFSDKEEDASILSIFIKITCRVGTLILCTLRCEEQNKNKTPQNASPLLVLNDFSQLNTFELNSLGLSWSLKQHSLRMLIQTLKTLRDKICSPCFVPWLRLNWNGVGIFFSPDGRKLFSVPGLHGYFLFPLLESDRANPYIRGICLH